MSLILIGNSVKFSSSSSTCRIENLAVPTLPCSSSFLLPQPKEIVYLDFRALALFEKIQRAYPHRAVQHVHLYIDAEQENLDTNLEKVINKLRATGAPFSVQIPEEGSRAQELKSCILARNIACDMMTRASTQAYRDIQKIPYVRREAGKALCTTKKLKASPKKPTRGPPRKSRVSAPKAKAVGIALHRSGRHTRKGLSEGSYKIGGTRKTTTKK